MNDDVSAALFDFYGTARAEEPQAQDEDTVKAAQFEFLVERVKQAGHDVDSVTPEQWEALYNETFSAEQQAAPEPEKTASEQQAEEEFVRAKLAQEAFADADARGRIQAHAFMDELNKIAGKNSVGGKGRNPVRLHLPEPFRAAGAAAKRHAGSAATSAKGAVGKAIAAVKAHKKPAAGVAAGLAALGVGGGLAAHHYAKKEASAIDFEAAKLASVMVEQSGIENAETAADRFDALFEQGIPDSGTKVAQANDFDTALQIRALELAEMVGYPVTWNA